MKEIDARKKVYLALDSFEKYEIFKSIYIYVPTEFNRLISINVCDFINTHRHNYNWNFEIEDGKSSGWKKYKITKLYSSNKEINDIQQIMKIIIDEAFIEKGE